MSLSTTQIKLLERIIEQAQDLLSQAKAGEMSKASSRKRRSGKELITFRKMLKAEVNSGVSVAEVAKKHNVTTAYIYQLDGIKRAMAAAKKAGAKTVRTKPAAKVPANKTTPKKVATRKSQAKKTSVKKAPRKPVQSSGAQQP